MPEFTIGEAANRAGVNIETLRYYERRGLVPPPPRSHSNYRLYPSDTVRLVRFVKRAQDLGFTLSEIKELLAFRGNAAESTCGDVRDQALGKMRDIDDKLRALQAMRGALSELVGRCPGQGPVGGCPILESLEPEIRS
jgi:MerR family mercuric resistance operon transcriptional regulator